MATARLTCTSRGGGFLLRSEHPMHSAHTTISSAPTPPDAAMMAIFCVFLLEAFEGDVELAEPDCLFKGPGAVGGGAAGAAISVDLV